MCLKKEKNKTKHGLHGLKIFIPRFCNKWEYEGCWISSVGNISNEYKARMALREIREYSNCITCLTGPWIWPEVCAITVKWWITRCQSIKSVLDIFSPRKKMDFLDKSSIIYTVKVNVKKCIMWCSEFFYQACKAGSFYIGLQYRQEIG